MDTNNTLKHDRNAGHLIEQMQNYVKGAKVIKYLEDDLHVVNINENHKVRIFGTPWTKRFGYSFKTFQKQEKEISHHWQKIPSDIDILISHSPPFGILDENCEGTKSNTSIPVQV